MSLNGNPIDHRNSGALLAPISCPALAQATADASCQDLLHSFLRISDPALRRAALACVRELEAIGNAVVAKE